jgi:hypothetical protein
MTSTEDETRSNEDRPRNRLLLLLCVGLLLLCGMVGACAQTGQLTDAEDQVKPAESSSDPSASLVRPVEFQEAAGSFVPVAVSMTGKAADFSPPAQLPVYKINPAEPVTRASMDALATKLGFGQNRGYGEEGLSGSRGSLTFPRADDATCFMLVNTGMIDGAFAAILAGQPPQPVSAEETRDIADAYLKALGMQAGLTFLETYEATAYGTATLDGKEERWVVEMGARYQAFVDGVPLVGPGSKVSVGVGPDGSVAEFYHFAQKAGLAEQNVIIRPVEAALADLELGKGAVPPDINSERAKNITVESVELCYYAPPAPSADMYYKPVYVFHVRMSDGTLGDWLLAAFDGSTLQGAI